MQNPFNFFFFIFTIYQNYTLAKNLIAYLHTFF